MGSLKLFFNKASQIKTPVSNFFPSIPVLQHLKDRQLDRGRSGEGERVTRTNIISSPWRKCYLQLTLTWEKGETLLLTEDGSSSLNILIISCIF